jgi:hypothetical protein
MTTALHDRDPGVLTIDSAVAIDILMASLLVGSEIRRTSFFAVPHWALLLSTVRERSLRFCQILAPNLSNIFVSIVRPVTRKKSFYTSCPLKMANCCFPMAGIGQVVECIAFETGLKQGYTDKRRMVVNPCRLSWQCETILTKRG